MLLFKIFQKKNLKDKLLLNKHFKMTTYNYTAYESDEIICVKKAKILSHFRVIY